MSIKIANDALLLSEDDECCKMLMKMGDNYPEPEIIRLSEQVIKINAKHKQQKRVLLITDKALYNLIPNSYKQCKRRIPMEKIASITISTSSQQFAVENTFHCNHINFNYTVRIVHRYIYRMNTIICSYQTRERALYPH